MCGPGPTCHLRPGPCGSRSGASGWHSVGAPEKPRARSHASTCWEEGPPEAAACRQQGSGSLHTQALGSSSPGSEGRLTGSTSSFTRDMMLCLCSASCPPPAMRRAGRRRGPQGRTHTSVRCPFHAVSIAALGLPQDKGHCPGRSRPSWPWSLRCSREKHAPAGSRACAERLPLGPRSPWSRWAARGAQARA